MAQDIMKLLADADARHGFPSGLMASIFKQETGGSDEYVRNPTKAHYPTGRTKSGAISSAFGPFGLLKSTAAKPGYGIKPLSDAKNLAEQVRFASDYLKARIKTAGGNLEKGLDLYGSGPNSGYGKSVLGRVDPKELPTPNTYAGNGNRMTQGNPGESVNSNYQPLPEIAPRENLTTAQLPPLTEAQAVQVAQAQAPEGRSAQGGDLPAGANNPWIKFQTAMRQKEQQPQIATPADLNFGNNVFSDVKDRVQPMQTNVDQFTGFGKGNTANPRAMAMLNKILSEQPA